MRLWPAVRAAKLMKAPAELVVFHATGPWRLRVSDAGEGLLLDRWRAHLDVLAIRGLWAADHRVGPLVREAAAVARTQGFSAVLSPLLTLSALEPYLAAGMAERERIIALQAHADEAARLGSGAARVRAATEADMDRLVEIDAASFDDFWRYGRPELVEAKGDGELFVAERDGEVVGYHTVAHHGASSTVGRLAVDPDRRRLGVARSLLGDAASRAVRAGSFVLTLCTQETNAASRALYAAAGFTEVDEEYALAVLEA